MVGMFDAALRATGAGGDYDAARACAVRKLEEAKRLPYETVSGVDGHGVGRDNNPRWRLPAHLRSSTVRGPSGAAGTHGGVRRVPSYKLPS